MSKTQRTRNLVVCGGCFSLAAGLFAMSCGGEESNNNGGGSGGSATGGAATGGGDQNGTGAATGTGAVTGAGGTSTGGAGGGQNGDGGQDGTGGGAGDNGNGNGNGNGGPVPGAENFNCDPPDGDRPELRLAQVASGFSNPTFMTSFPGAADRWLVLEQDGRIQLVIDGEVEAEPFLDITSEVMGGFERGLLGLAFHPNFDENQLFYLHYTVSGGPDSVSVIEEYRVSASDPNQGEKTERPRIYSINQPAGNHNGGWVGFNRDGYLYFSLGDGGGAQNRANSQNLDSGHGSILRIDVDNPAGDAQYSIPDGNITSGTAHEIWSYGLRNPWRVSVDGCTGDIYIADVGEVQGGWEEINVEPFGEGNNNYGWPIMEGEDCFGAQTCNMAGLTMPDFAYPRGGGAAVTGGYVYRGSNLPGLRGAYLFADYVRGQFWLMRYENGQSQTTEITDEINPTNLSSFSSFGQDADGEVYVVGRNNGVLYRIEAQ